MDETSGPPPPKPKRVGILNRSGATAKIKRATFGSALEAGVDNSGTLEDEDSSYE